MLNIINNIYFNENLRSLLENYSKHNKSFALWVPCSKSSRVLGEPLVGSVGTNWSNSHPSQSLRCPGRDSMLKKARSLPRPWRQARVLSALHLTLSFGASWIFGLKLSTVCSSIVENGNYKLGWSFYCISEICYNFRKILINLQYTDSYYITTGFFYSSAKKYQITPKICDSYLNINVLKKNLIDLIEYLENALIYRVFYKIIIIIINL